MKKLVVALMMVIGLSSVAQADCGWEMVIDPYTGELVHVYVCD